MIKQHGHYKSGLVSVGVPSMTIGQKLCLPLSHLSSVVSETPTASLGPLHRQVVGALLMGSPGPSGEAG